MIYDTLHKVDGHKNRKNHLGVPNTFAALCHMAGVENTGGAVEFKNRKWYQEGTITGEFSIEIPESQVKKTFCAYCEAIAYCDERTGRR